MGSNALAEACCLVVWKTDAVTTGTKLLPALEHVQLQLTRQVCHDCFFLDEYSEDCDDLHAWMLRIAHCAKTRLAHTQLIGDNNCPVCF